MGPVDLFARGHEVREDTSRHLRDDRILARYPQDVPGISFDLCDWLLRSHLHHVRGSPSSIMAGPPFPPLPSRAGFTVVDVRGDGLLVGDVARRGDTTRQRSGYMRPRASSRLLGARRQGTASTERTRWIFWRSSGTLSVLA